MPPYKTWIHLPNNKLSLETGQRMFYTGGRGCAAGTPLPALFGMACLLWDGATYL